MTRCICKRRIRGRRAGSAYPSFRSIHAQYSRACYSSLFEKGVAKNSSTDAYRSRYQTHLRKGRTALQRLQSRDHREQPIVLRSKECDSWTTLWEFNLMIAWEADGLVFLFPSIDRHNDLDTVTS